jgi:hypothetical protein
MCVRVYVHMHIQRASSIHRLFGPDLKIFNIEFVYFFRNVEIVNSVYEPMYSVVQNNRVSP